MAAGEERRKQALILSPVGRIRRRLNREVWLGRLVLPAWCAVSAVAAWRLLLHRYTALAGVGIALCGIAWWIARSRGHRVSLGQAAVLTDRLAGAGGLLLTRLELPVGEWELSLNERMHSLPAPPTRLARPSLALLASLLFLAIALAVPLSEPLVGRVNAAAAGKVAEVEAKAEALAKEKPLDENVQGELERLRQEALQDRFDAKDWEAADGLEAGLDRKAAEAGAELARATDAAKALEDALDKAQGHDGAAREREELERALADLAGDKSDDGKPAGPDEKSQPAGAQKGSEGTQGSGKQESASQDAKSGAQDSKRAQGRTSGAQGPKSGGSKSDVSQLRKALENRMQQLASAFNEGSGSPQAGSKPQKGEGQKSSSGEGTQVASGESDGEPDPDGAGAPVHGPGKGRLRFGPVPELHPERLQFAPLPAGNGGEAKELWGLSAADPRVHAEPSKAAVGSGIATGEQTPGNRQEQILPRNRELVRRYFDSSR